MGSLFDSISTELDATYKIPHETNPIEVEKLDLKVGSQIIVDEIEKVLQARVLQTPTLLTARDEPPSASMLYCKEVNLFYKYKEDTSEYIEYGNTVIHSSVSGGWVEHDSLNKFINASSVISLEHSNQSSAISLTAPTDFTAKPDQFTNNGHTHVCKIFCDGHIPTFSGFEFLADSSPLDISTIDTSPGYYHTLIFFKLANINRFIILEKVLSTDTTPPTITVSVNNITDSAITFSIASDKSAELNWAIYSAGSPDKSQSDIQNGVGAIQSGTQSIAAGNNSVTIESLSASSNYDLWQYAIDAALNASSPAKTTAQTSAPGLIQLTAPVFGTVSMIDTVSLSVPIASSAIDANAVSVSLFYKLTVDSVFTEVSEILPSDATYTLGSLDPNTAYDIYIKAIGDGVIYSDSPNSNIVTQTTQNIAPILDIPYTSSDGLTIELPFSRAMIDPSTQVELFSVSGGKLITSVSLKSGNSSIIQVTVDTAYISTDIITITIASGLIPADGGLVYGGVTDQSVTNSIESYIITTLATAEFDTSAAPLTSFISGISTQSYNGALTLTRPNTPGSALVWLDKPATVVAGDHIRIKFYNLVLNSGKFNAFVYGTSPSTANQEITSGGDLVIFDVPSYPSTYNTKIGFGGSSPFPEAIFSLTVDKVVIEKLE